MSDLTIFNIGNGSANPFVGYNLIWENPDPAVSTMGKKLTSIKNLNQYSVFGVVCREYSIGEDVATAVLLNTGVDDILQCVHSFKNINTSRMFTVHVDDYASYIEYDNAYHNGVYIGSYLIPYRIYGIR